MEEVKEEMQKYKSDLKQFMLDTPLDVLCKTQKRGAVKLPPGFNQGTGSKFFMARDTLGGGGISTEVYLPLQPS